MVKLRANNLVEQGMRYIKTLQEATEQEWQIRQIGTLYKSYGELIEEIKEIVSKGWSNEETNEYLIGNFHTTMIGYQSLLEIVVISEPYNTEQVRRRLFHLFQAELKIIDALMEFFK